MQRYNERGSNPEFTEDKDLFEGLKAEYSRREATDPMEEAFYAVMVVQGHNIANIRSLRADYPDEWHRRMQLSVENEGDKFSHAFRTLGAIFDQDDVEVVQELCEQEAILGIPAEFLQREDVRRYMVTLSDRSWADGDVNLYLKTFFHLPLEEVSLYDDDGSVLDSEVAREMATVENPYHDKRFFGILPPSKKSLQKGERLAEKKGDEIINKKNQRIRDYNDSIDSIR